MGNNQTEELDLTLGFNLLKKMINRWAVLLLRGVQFVIRKWVIIVLLTVIGFVSGYILTGKKNQEARLLLRINFDMVNYVYSEVATFDKKVNEKNVPFLKKMGLNPDSTEVTGLEMLPIINIKEIIKNIEDTDRSFESVLRNLEFDEIEDFELYESFTSEYKYHILTISLSPWAKKESIDIVLKYFNNNDLLKELKVIGIKNIEDHIAYNEKMIDQIDQVLDTYHTNESLNSPSDQIYIVDKNFNISQIIISKVEIQKETKELKEELVFSKDVVVVVNRPTLTNENLGILGKKKIVYPILLVFSFLFLAWIRHVYNHVKEMDNQSK